MRPTAASLGTRRTGPSASPFCARRRCGRAGRRDPRRLGDRAPFVDPPPRSLVRLTRSGRACCRSRRRESGSSVPRGRQELAGAIRGHHAPQARGKDHGPPREACDGRRRPVFVGVLAVALRGGANGVCRRADRRHTFRCGRAGRVEAQTSRGALVARAGGGVTCLVSGGADSTCLWHVLGELGYRVSALHVAHGLRGAESDEDARFCRETRAPRSSRAGPAAPPRPSCASCATRSRPTGLRATGHTASDQVESVLLRLVASGSPQRIKAKREDGVVRPLLGLARGDARLLRRARAALPGGHVEPGHEARPDPERDPAAARAARSARPLSLLALADERPRLPRTLERTLAELLASRDGTKSADLGAGVRAVREYGTLRLEGSVEWGPWTIESDRPGLDVRARRPGDRLAGRRKKVQDLLVDAKVPRRSGTAGRSSSAATRSSRCRVWRRRRGGKER